MKAMNIIFGALSVMVGCLCFAHPFASQLMYGYIVAVLMGAVGVCSLFSYFAQRKAAKASGLDAVTGTVNLAIGIFGIVFMLLNMTVPFFTYSVQEFGAILVALFMLVEGVSFVVRAVTNKSGAGMVQRLMIGILGVLMIIAFAAALAFPAIIISMFGIFLGTSLLVQGITRIYASVTLL